MGLPAHHPRVVVPGPRRRMLSCMTVRPDAAPALQLAVREVCVQFLTAASRPCLDCTTWCFIFHVSERGARPNIYGTQDGRRRSSVSFFSSLCNPQIFAHCPFPVWHGGLVTLGLLARWPL